MYLLLGKNKCDPTNEVKFKLIHFVVYDTFTIIDTIFTIHRNYTLQGFQ